jgi:hypothetical protein
MILRKNSCKQIAQIKKWIYNICSAIPANIVNACS